MGSRCRRNEGRPRRIAARARSSNRAWPSASSRAVAGGTLHATTRIIEALDQADLSLICVGTPSTSVGGTDLSYVGRVVTDIARGLALVAPPAGGFHSVVDPEHSAARHCRRPRPPCTRSPARIDRARALRRRLLPRVPPRRLRRAPTSSTHRSRCVGTTDPRVAEAVQRALRVPRSARARGRVGTAEALKYACNAFHALKVSFANEMARVLRHLDVDARAVMEVFCDDDRLNISPQLPPPGFAFGGSCLPKDLRALLYLARMNNVDLPLLDGDPGVQRAHDPRRRRPGRRDGRPHGRASWA